MKKTTFAALLLAAATAGGLAAQPALAQDTAEEPKVIARVNGDPIYQSDLVAFVQRLPQQIQAQVQMLMPQILDQLVNNKLSTQAGREAGLAADAEVMAQVEKIEDLIIGQFYLQRAIDAQITDEKLEVAYQAFLAENPPARELIARHILVETEDEAKAVITELDAGADFAELAKTKSTGPSGAKGGELPPFQADQMVPEFSEAAFAMEEGTYSSAPVKTQFGYHVILVEESRMTEPPSKAEVEDQLRDQLQQQAAEDVFAELRDGAEIEMLIGQQQDAAPAQQEPSGEAPAEAQPEAAPEGSGAADPAPGNN